jgi:hypothetical protein
MFDMINNINEIKIGMIVKLRNGDECIVTLDSRNEIILRDIHHPSRIAFLSAYDKLTFNHLVSDDYDIMQVFEVPTHCDDELHNRPHLVSPIAWERPKDEKKDTEERINEIFKEVVRLVEEYEKLRG